MKAYLIYESIYEEIVAITLSEDEAIAYCSKYCLSYQEIELTNSITDLYDMDLAHPKDGF